MKRSGIQKIFESNHERKRDKEEASKDYAGRSMIILKMGRRRKMLVLNIFEK
jgi:hypothetical protein